MKKVILLMVAGSFLVAANAQESQRSSVIFQKSGSQSLKPVTENNVKQANFPKIADDHRFHSGDKTTLGGGRWYSYAAYQEYVLGGPNYVSYLANMWNTKTGILGYSGPPTYDTCNYMSFGEAFDPMYPPFNDASIFTGIQVTSTDSYTIDSVGVKGYYARTNTSSAVDTLRLGFVYGDGASATTNLQGYITWGTMASYGVDTLPFLLMMHDSIKNCARKTLSTSVDAIVQDVPLLPADSSSMYYFARNIALTTPMVVPPGEISGISLTYVNGDAYTDFDTIRYTDGSLKYNEFEYSIFYKGDSATGTTAYPTYTTTDKTSGYMHYRIWDEATYTANWSLTNTVSGSTVAPYFQFPELWVHITCLTCHPVGVKDVNKNNVISEVKAYPIPANNELNVSFSFSQNSNVNITLSNMLGQVVAIQDLNDVTIGEATFNTTSLAAGVYLCTLISNDGVRSTGHVVIAH